MRQASHAYRAGLAIAVGTAACLVVGAGALGIIGDGRADRAYVTVLAVLVVGSALARLRPAGMAVALSATALTQVLVPVVLLVNGAAGTRDVSLLDVAGLTALFAGMFLASAWQFRRSAGRVRVLPRDAAA